MAEVLASDGTRLHVEIDGAGEPVTVLAHGLTNSCKELSAFTPMAPGTKIRFCFRGHGHSGTPEAGHYRFADFAGDVDAVARAYGATRAVGTSLGQGAITWLLSEDPDRFERLVFILPAALDVPLSETEVAGFAAQGLSDKEIARRLDLKFATVRTHLDNAFAKLGVRNRTQLVSLLYGSDRGDTRN